MCFKLDFDPPENLESLYYPRSALTLTDTERRYAESILEIDMELFGWRKYHIAFPLKNTNLLLRLLRRIA